MYKVHNYLVSMKNNWVNVTRTDKLRKAVLNHFNKESLPTEWQSLLPGSFYNPQPVPGSEKEVITKFYFFSHTGMDKLGQVPNYTGTVGRRIRDDAAALEVYKAIGTTAEALEAEDWGPTAYAWFKFNPLKSHLGSLPTVTKQEIATFLNESTILMDEARVNSLEDAKIRVKAIDIYIYTNGLDSLDPLLEVPLPKDEWVDPEIEEFYTVVEIDALRLEAAVEEWYHFDIAYSKSYTVGAYAPLWKDLNYESHTILNQDLITIVDSGHDYVDHTIDIPLIAADETLTDDQVRINSGDMYKPWYNGTITYEAAKEHPASFAAIFDSVNNDRFEVIFSTAKDRLINRTDWNTRVVGIGDGTRTVYDYKTSIDVKFKRVSNVVATDTLVTEIANEVTDFSVGADPIPWIDRNKVDWYEFPPGKVLSPLKQQLKYMLTTLNTGPDDILATTSLPIDDGESDYKAAEKSFIVAALEDIPFDERLDMYKTLSESLEVDTVNRRQNGLTRFVVALVNLIVLAIAIVFTAFTGNPVFLALYVAVAVGVGMLIKQHGGVVAAHTYNSLTTYTVQAVGVVLTIYGIITGIGSAISKLGSALSTTATASTASTTATSTATSGAGGGANLGTNQTFSQWISTAASNVYDAVVNYISDYTTAITDFFSDPMTNLDTLLQPVKNLNNFAKMYFQSINPGQENAPPTEETPVTAETFLLTQIEADNNEYAEMLNMIEKSYPQMTTPGLINTTLNRYYQSTS